MKKSLERWHIHKRIAIFMAFIMVLTMLPMHTLQVYAKSNEAKILIWSTYTSAINKGKASYLKDFISKNEVACYAGVDSISVDLKVDGTQSKPQHFMGTEDLSQYGMIIVYLPCVSLTDTDVSTLKKYVNAGGRLILCGEYDGYARQENKVLSDFAQKLGATFQITNSVDGGIGNAIINKDSDIMGGKNLEGNELEYRAVGEITYSGDAQVIATSVNRKYPFIVDLPVQKGRITVISDISWWYRTSSTALTPAQLQSAQELWGKFLSNSAENMETVKDGNNPNEKHEHHYNYISQDNKILAYCDETQGAFKCEYYGMSKAIVVTLLAGDTVYSGEAYSGITLEGIDTYNAITKSDLEKSQVSFYQVETKGTTTGGIKLESAPKEKGHYYAKITSNGAQAVAAFSINGLAHSITIQNGTTEIADSKAEEDTIVTIKADAAPAGKVFDKWTSDDVTFADANSEETTFNMPNKDVTVTAHYIEKQYTVTFDANGHGKAPMELTNVIGGTQIKAPINLAETGYIFAGWYKEAECINPWNFETDTVTADTMLYAKWEPNTSEYIISSSDLKQLNMGEHSTIVIGNIQMTAGSGCEAVGMESGAVFFGDNWGLSMLEGNTIIGITIITDISCNASDIVNHSTSKWHASGEDDIATWSGTAKSVNFGAYGNYISEIRVKYENVSY